MPRLLDLAAFARRLHVLDQSRCGLEETQAPGALLFGCSVGAGGDMVVDGLAVCVDEPIWVLVSFGPGGPLKMGEDGLTRIWGRGSDRGCRLGRSSGPRRGSY